MKKAGITDFWRLTPNATIKRPLFGPKKKARLLWPDHQEREKIIERENI